MRQTLIVFAREPIAGRTKTRLCPPLDGAAAAALYACFLSDTLDQARQLAQARVAVAYTPESDPAFFAKLAPDLIAFPQRGADLGERMHNAICDAFVDLDRERYQQSALRSSAPDRSSVVVIGSDSPDLPPAYLAEAFARLAFGADVVLGPSDDGGYYLIGLRAPQPRLLHEVTMSMPTVLADTLALARELGLRAELLPPWYDVDTAAELWRLAEHLRQAGPGVAPRTRAFLDASLFG